MPTHRELSQKDYEALMRADRHGRHTFNDFLPLLVVFAVVLAFTAFRLSQLGAWNAQFAMANFMGIFFAVFGALKLLDWRGFVNSYAEYDLLARRFRAYGWAYPLIEAALGIAYLFDYHVLWVSVITLIVMAVSAAGVYQALWKKTVIHCACLGTVFKLPMTKISLLEDVLMAAMASIMIIMII